jgi:hypothetical protein
LLDYSNNVDERYHCLHGLRLRISERKTARSHAFIPFSPY